MYRRYLSNEEILKIIKDFYDKKGRVPSPKELSNKDYQLIRIRFGTFDTACKLAIGQIDLETQAELFRIMLSKELKSFYKNIGRYPRLEDFGNGILSPIEKYYEAFHCENWESLNKYLDITPNELKRPAVSKGRKKVKSMPDLKKMLEKECQRQGKTIEYIAKQLNTGISLVENYFKGDGTILNAEQLEQLFELLSISCTPCKSKYTNSGILEEVKSFYEKNNRIPRATDLKCYPILVKRFGTLSKAIEKAGLNPQV